MVGLVGKLAGAHVHKISELFLFGGDKTINHLAMWIIPSA